MSFFAKFPFSYRDIIPFLIRNKKIVLSVLAANLLVLFLLGFLTRAECYECSFHDTTYVQEGAIRRFIGTQSSLYKKARVMCQHFSPTYLKCDIKECKKIMCDEKKRYR